jgi:excisionase family DNA binding protein
MTLFPKKNEPWRRVVRTVRVAEGQFYDELECGHRETYDCMANKRRCRTCTDPAFPGITVEPQNPQPSVVDQPTVGSPPSLAPSPGSNPIPLVLTAEEVAELLRVDKKTVYAAAANGELPGVRRIGSRLRFYGPALAKWLETGAGSKARPPSPRSAG